MCAVQWLGFCNFCVRRRYCEYDAQSNAYPSAGTYHVPDFDINYRPRDRIQVKCCAPTHHLPV
jgi:hypothetical protein